MDPIARIDAAWSRSQLFTLRVWYEGVDADGWEVRVQARHILTGETRYFRDWPALIAYLTGKLDLLHRPQDAV